MTPPRANRASSQRIYAGDYRGFAGDFHPLEIAKPFGRGVNFEIKVCNVDQLHLAIVAAGKNCFLPIEERWYRRHGRELGVRQFAVQDPDG